MEWDGWIKRRIRSFVRNGTEGIGLDWIRACVFLLCDNVAYDGFGRNGLQDMCLMTDGRTDGRSEICSSSILEFLSLFSFFIEGCERQ